MPTKIFTACLGTETNSFSPIPTGMDLFRRTMLVRGGQHGEKPNLFALPLVVWRERARALGWEVAEGVVPALGGGGVGWEGLGGTGAVVGRASASIWTACRICSTLWINPSARRAVSTRAGSVWVPNFARTWLADSRAAGRFPRRR